MILDFMDYFGNCQLVESVKVIKSRLLMKYIYDL